MDSYATMYDRLYAAGYNDHAKGWGERVGLLPWMVKNLRIHDAVDIGCGRGQDVEYLRAHDICAFGVDVSVEAVKKSPYCSHLDLTQDAGWGDYGLHDTAVSSDTLEHLRPEDVPGALRRMVSVCGRYMGIRTAAFETKSGEICGYTSEDIHPTRQGSEWWIEQFTKAASEQGREAVVLTRGRGWFVLHLTKPIEQGADDD